MSRLVALLALLVANVCWSAHAAETRHIVILGGNKAGIQTSKVAADGTREIKFEFNDRGRGPDLTSRIELGEAGLPRSVQTAGKNYLKIEVQETFTLDRDVARWRNDAENG